MLRRMKPVPMRTIVTEAIDPALALLPAKMDSIKARLQVLTIGAQEGDNYQSRVQYNGGPARSFWQMERGGGVLGVLTHSASKAHALHVCSARNVPPDSRSVWLAMEKDDVLGAAFARLLLWTDPLALPAIGNAAGAWELYIRTWRPGKQRRETWDGYYNAARQALGV